MKHSLMSQEAKKELINLVKVRYQYYNLSFKQAEQIYEFENNKHLFSVKHMLSEWEEMDFEWTLFREILNPKQWVLYEPEYNRRKKEYENNLLEMDKSSIREIQFHLELLQYYKNIFLPELLKKNSFRETFIYHIGELPKLEFLKVEFKKYLQETRDMLFKEHFRHNRTFRPNELTNSLIRHEISYVFPEYSQFKHHMDHPTKMVATYLFEKMKNSQDEQLILLKKLFGELEIFSNKLFLKYYSSTNNVVHYGKQSPEEEKESHIMGLILLDMEMYSDTTWHNLIPHILKTD